MKHASSAFAYTISRLMLLIILSSGALGAAPAQAAAQSAAPASAPDVVVLPGSAERFYKLGVTQTGMHAVTYQALSAAGLPVDTLDPATFQVFEQGQEIARRVVDANLNSAFDAGDFVLFYGRGVDTDFTGVNIYWLTYGYGPGLAMAARAAAPGAGLPVVETFQETLHLEQNTRWSKGLPKSGAADRWYWWIYTTQCSKKDPLGNPTPQPAVWPLAVNTPGVAAGAFSATLTPRIRGFNDVANHTAIFDVNGTVIGQAQFTWQNEFAGSINFNQSLLKQGANTITLTAPCPSPTTIDYGAINWYDLTYHRNYAAPAAGQFAFAVDASQPSKVTLTGLPDTGAQVYDITDPLRPVMLTGAQIAGADLAFTHTPAAAGRYIAAAAGQHLAPASIVLDAASHLRAPAAGADWIIISHANFISEAERLAEHRRLYQQYRTAVVDVQDVYDEFNGGLMDQEAIRAFLQYAYLNWPRPAAQFVVLVGDGHYDPRGRSYDYNGAPFFMPPYLAPVDPFEGTAASDNRYVAFDPPAGQPNPMPFMHLGRLSANTLADATAMVDKIIAYETAPAHADWNTKTIFAADNADAGGLFPESSNLVATDPYYLPGYALTTANHISLTLGAGATATVNFGFLQPGAAAFGTAAAGPAAQPASNNGIQGRIWEDLNGDGVIDADEGGLPEIDVCLYRDPNLNGKVDLSDPLVSCTTSDSNGNYGFAALADDHYLLEVNELDPDLPSLFQRRSLYCDRTNPAQSSSFFCNQDGAPTRLNVTAAKSELIKLINDGALFVNYHGHASADKWADEFLLRTSDLSALTNTGRYPIMLPMTCLEGQYIGLSISGFGESIVRLKDAGAVASWSPTGKGTSNGHEIIWTAFYEAIFDNGERLIGPATTYAKSKLYESNRVFKDLIDTYVLFGDPAMPLDLPSADLWVQKEVAPDTPWAPGQALTFTLTYGNAGSATATGVRLTDTLSSELANRSWTSSDPGVMALAGPDYSWSLPNLAPGASGAITMTGVYSPSQAAAAGLAGDAVITSETWERPALLSDNTAPSRMTVGGYAYQELTRNTVFDPGDDAPIDGLQLSVTDSLGNVVATPVSGATGYWSADLLTGNYTVTAPANWPGLSLNTANPTGLKVSGSGAALTNFGYVAPTDVGIEFEVAWQAGGARVMWHTRDESQIEGFHVYRSTSSDTQGSQINPSLILPKTGTAPGADYEYIDQAVTVGSKVYYWLRVQYPGGETNFLWLGPRTPGWKALIFLPFVRGR